MQKLFLSSCFIFLLSIHCSLLLAQSSQFKLSGKVIDAENGSSLAGVTVSSLTNNKTVNTDAEGNFFLLLEKNKAYTLRFTSVGYLPDQINGMAENTGSPALTVALVKSKKELETVVVRANIRKEALSALYTLQKNSSSISDGISAEVIRKSPDKNMGDVLKRVSGTSVQDNKFVVIRGLSERYNTSLLNNAVLPSTEADKKAFAFDIIPASVIDNLVIYKSATPDLPGDFSGGAIKVSTKDYPARKISELSLSIGHNSLTTGRDFYKSFPNGALDAIGFFDNSRLIPGPYYRNRYGFISRSSAFKNTVTKLFPNTFGYSAANKSLPNLSLSYTGGNTTILKKGNKIGYIYSIGYSVGRAVVDKERSDYDFSKRYLYNYFTNNYEERNNLSSLLNVTYSYGRSKISLKNLFNNNFVKTTGIRDGVNYENGANSPFYIKSDNTEASGNGLINSVLEGMHRLNKSWTIDWNGSFAYTYRNQPDQRILTFRSPENEDDNYYLKLNYENSPEIRNAGRVYSFLKENMYGASVNVTRYFNWLDQSQKLKFGAMNYYRNRSVEVDALGYATLDFYGVTIPEFKGTNYTSVFTPDNIDTYNLTVANIETNSTDYTGNALMNAGYVMLDNKFSDKIKLTWGARVEKYRQELTARNKGTKVYDNTDILPSFLFTYSVNNKTNIRAAASQAVNRPEFRELADYSVFDYDLYVAVRGNPTLERSKSTNADIRYEWFPEAGEIISGSLFYKYFNNPIEQVNKGNDVLSYENADHAITYGAEIEVRKKLDFIGGNFFQQLSLYTNAAYMKGSVQFNGQHINSPLQGQSPYLINSGITYTSANNDFSCNLLYNRIGPRLRFRAQAGGALDIFERPRDVFDFQISKKILKNKLEAKLTFSDILAQPVSWYYKYEANPSNINYKSADDKIINTTRNGTTATLSLRYSFERS